jgi:hypothetical protein
MGTQFLAHKRNEVGLFGRSSFHDQERIFNILITKSWSFDYQKGKITNADNTLISQKEDILINLLNINELSNIKTYLAPYLFLQKLS